MRIATLRQTSLCVLHTGFVNAGARSLSSVLLLLRRRRIALWRRRRHAPVLPSIHSETPRQLRKTNQKNESDGKNESEERRSEKEPCRRWAAMDLVKW
jgi:hypothetical protein